MTLSASVERIDREKALKMLSRNTARNRKLSQATVKGYAAEMLAGRWAVTHQGIALSADGTLVDGQHRLAAIVLITETHPDFSIEMLVIRGADENDFGRMDVGNKRSAAQFMGGTSSTLRAAFARVVLQAYLNDGVMDLGSVRGSGLKQYRITDFIDDNPHIDQYAREYASLAVRAKKQAFAGTSSLGLLVGGFAASSGLKTDKYADWWSEVRDRTYGTNGLNPGSPVLALSNATELVTGGRSALAIMRAAYAGSKYREGDTLFRLADRYMRSVYVL